VHDERRAHSSGFRRVTTSFAVPTLLAIAATVIAIVNQRREGGFHPHLIGWLIIAWPASLAASLAAQSRRWSPSAGTGLSILIAGLAIAAQAFAKSIGLTDITFIASLIIACSAAPLAGLRDTDSLWLWNEKFWSAALIVLAGAFLGRLATVTTIDAADRLFGLFALETRASLREDARILFSFAFAPIVFLAVLPRVESGILESGGGDVLRRAVGALGTWALAPFVLVYAALLWLYAGKIALAGVLPDGQVGEMVGVFGFGGLAAVLATYPQRETGKIQVRLLWRIWPFLLIVPLILLAIAIRERIDEYGLTPDRYIAILLGLLCAVNGIVALAGRARIVTFAPTVLALGLLAVSFGPWGAKEASLRWQTASMRQILAAHGELKDGALDAHATPAQLTVKEWRRWRAAFELLRREQRLRAFVGVKVAAYEDDAADMLNARVEGPKSEPYLRKSMSRSASTWVAPPGAPADMSILAYVAFVAPETVNPALDDIKIAQTPSGLVLTWKGGPPTQFEARDLQSLLDVHGNLSEMPLLRPSGGDRSFSLLLDAFQLDVENRDAPRVTWMHAYILRSVTTRF
jgi:hypothetical protein